MKSLLFYFIDKFFYKLLLFIFYDICYDLDFKTIIITYVYIGIVNKYIFNGTYYSECVLTHTK